MLVLYFLRYGGLKLGVQNPDLVYSFSFVLLQDGVENRPDIVGRGLVGEGRLNRRQVYLAQTADKLGALATDGQNIATDFSDFVGPNRLGQ